MKILKNTVSDKSILVVGLCRDCEKTIIPEIKRLDREFAFFKSYEWFVVESDSKDKSVASLERLSMELKNFKFVSLGYLALQYPLRTERLAYCRNEYVKMVRENEKKFDYVLVLDLDGINTELTSESLISVFSRDDWDGCFANNSYRYYDLWALRCSLWCDSDCWKQRDFLLQFGLNWLVATYVAVYGKMLKIRKLSDWLPVSSAFGGAAIYRTNCFSNSFYVGLDSLGSEVCEHVHFNENLVSQGKRLFLVPNFVNGGRNEHNSFLILKAVRIFIFSKIFQAINKIQKKIKDD
jgi:hypothetical protein